MMVHHLVKDLNIPLDVKRQKARKHKAKTNNVNLLFKDILGYETRGNKLSERDVAMGWP